MGSPPAVGALVSCAKNLPEWGGQGSLLQQGWGSPCSGVRAHPAACWVQELSLSRHKTQPINQAEKPTGAQKASLSNLCTFGAARAGITDSQSISAPRGPGAAELPGPSGGPAQREPLPDFTAVSATVAAPPAPPEQTNQGPRPGAAGITARDLPTRRCKVNGRAGGSAEV